MGMYSVVFIIFLSLCLPTHSLARFALHVSMDPTSFRVKRVEVEFTELVSTFFAGAFHPVKRWDLQMTALFLASGVSLIFSDNNRDSVISAKAEM